MSHFFKNGGRTNTIATFVGWTKPDAIFIADTFVGYNTITIVATLTETLFLDSDLMLWRRLG